MRHRRHIDATHAIPTLYRLDARLAENLPPHRRFGFDPARNVGAVQMQREQPHLFEARVSRDAAQASLVEDFLALFGGRMQPVMARLIETGNLSEDDVAEAEKLLRELSRKRKES